MSKKSNPGLVIALEKDSNIFNILNTPATANPSPTSKLIYLAAFNILTPNN